MFQICHNHAMLNTPHNKSNPLSIQTHSKVHYLYIMKSVKVGMLVTYVCIAFVVIVVCKYTIDTYIIV